MTYTTGSVITAADYTAFANRVNTVWGSGANNFGYGQTNTVATLGSGASITATQWATLLTRISSAASHQGTSITAITNPTVGDTISAYAALDTNITAITTGAMNATASGSDSNVTTTTTSAWTSSATTSKTITWGSVDQMRYFFNAGGMIRLSFSRSGGAANPQNTSWTTMLSNVGTIVLTGQGDPAKNKTIAGTSYFGTTKIGGAGTPTTLAEGTGAFNLTGTSVELFKQFNTTYEYTSNYTQINASISGSTITFAVSLIDAAAGAVDSVDGTLTMNTTVRFPSTSTLTNTWGTPSQNSATWSLA